RTLPTIEISFIEVCKLLRICATARGSVAQGEHGKGGGRVGHELACMAGGVAFLVNRDSLPCAAGRLISLKPVQASDNIHVAFGPASSLEDMQDKAGCITVGSVFLLRAVAPNPRPE